MHRCAVLGIEEDDILVILIVRCEIVKEIPELPIHRLYFCMVDILAKYIRFQKYRSPRILFLQDIFKTQMCLCFHRRWNIKIVGMRIRKVEKNKIITRIECLNMSDQALHSVCCPHDPRVDNQSVIPTRDAIIDGVTASH